ncbi:hypothetical protein G9C98_004382 [Cotesia typhae]|uniref:Uncharacterized protein n=1 Tax=Cotesia typhae TaxID=2053667 RepID=A0A8J5QY86_9HYME|nr:hypothetical protein G9C98_004382 [Cotesia typhae]
MSQRISIMQRCALDSSLLWFRHKLYAANKHEFSNCSDDNPSSKGRCSSSVFSGLYRITRPLEE